MKRKRERYERSKILQCLSDETRLRLRYVLPPSSDAAFCGVRSSPKRFGASQPQNFPATLAQLRAVRSGQ